MANATGLNFIKAVRLSPGWDVELVVGADNIWEGTMVALKDEAPYEAVPGTTADSGNCIGVALQSKVRGENVLVNTSAMWEFETAGGEDLITRDTVQMGQYVYMLDDHTVGSRATGDGGPRKIAGVYIGESPPDFPGITKARILFEPGTTRIDSGDEEEEG